jgi:hypothetical protein
MTDNLIRAIHEAMRRLSIWNARTNLDHTSWEYNKKIRELDREVRRCRDEAAKAFAQLNGWIVSRYDNGGYRGGEHGLYFRPPGRGRRKNVAAVAQSYHDAVPIVTRPGLLLPPDPWASFWYPGWTTFIAIVPARHRGALAS